ncbi:hypothetical protein PINS_up010743 [Pythium insidiosum]|nr:hypothetical protein PINS_up010743 [Pythium insidiosum]
MQVYKSSVLIGKVWINKLYVTLLVINCWSTPVIEFVFHKQPELERLLCIAFDIALDTATSMVLPFVIFYPYYANFNFLTYNFEIAYLYDDVWFANMVLENQQVFALSFWDFAWKIIPHLSVFSCVGGVEALVRQVRHQPRQVISATKAFDEAGNPTRTYESKLGPNSISAVAPSVNNKTIFAGVTMVATQRGILQRRGERVLKILHVLFFTWGLTVLALHLRAALKASSVDVPMCKQPTRPWFASNYSCSVLRFNCHRYNVSSVTDAHLEIIEDLSVIALVFMHCRELRVPRHIQSFHNLLGVDIFNSTIVQWDTSAAITNASHPILAYIIFVRVNMTALPEGVLQQLPDTATDVEITMSNLTTLPADLHERWHPMSIFYFEHSPATEFPATLHHLHADDLSLIGTRIERLPEFESRQSGFYTLAMTHTPLRELPASMGNLATIGFLNLGYTQLSIFLSGWQP